MDEQNNSFGYWLRRRRKALDLTQAALAEKVSCSPAAIKKIEAEERRPSRALAQRLAQQLGMPAQEREAFLDAARSIGLTARLRLDVLPVAWTSSPSTGESPTPSPDARHPFVGRDNEYGQFIGLVARLTAGSGHVVLIEGEAGIGKSRLMQEVVAYVRRQALPTLTTNCYEIERTMAYQPVIELATQACDAVPEARLRQIAPVLLAEVAALVPAMAARVPDLPPLSEDFPEARQSRLFHALIQLFDAVAHRHQLIVMFDNIQWADEASLRFLHFFARQVAARPMLLVCAYRDEDLGSSEQLAGLVESLRGEAHTRHMALAPLGPGDTQALLARLDDAKLDAPELAARLHRESDGNPFFLWSIMHSLREHQDAVSDGSSLPLPDSLRDSVRARLARVPVADRPLLDVAAVLGRRFDFETLLALTQMPEQRFLGALETLVKRRLLREEPDGGFYDFSHDKVREVVYQEIGTARRVLLHRQVAHLLEQHGTVPTHERNAHLAEHYERGKVWPKALHYLGLAADRSQKLFAMRESLQWFDRAVALVQAHPGAATPVQQLALYERRGAARVQAGHTDGAVADFQQVIDAARAAGQHEHARDVLIQLGMAYRRADAYEQAVACLDEALVPSRATGDERHVADTLYHLGTVAWSNGRNDLAISHHQEAVDICERLQLSDLVAVQAFHGRGEAYFANAEPKAAIASYSRSLELARGVGDKSYESENLMMIGWACCGHMGLADYPRAIEHFDAALQIAHAADLQWHLGPTLVGRAHAKAAQGQYAQAWSDLKDTLSRLETLHLVRYQMMTHDAMGCLLLDLNLNEEASLHFGQALALAQGSGLHYWLPRLQANQAIAQRRSGVRADEPGLRAACEYARQHRESWLTLRCLEALAELALHADDAQGCLGWSGDLMTLASGGGLRELVAQAHRLQGLARCALGEHRHAHEDLAAALAVAAQVGNVRLSWECHSALAEASEAAGDVVAARAHRSQARDRAAVIEQNLRGSGLAHRLAADQ